MTNKAYPHEIAETLRRQVAFSQFHLSRLMVQEKMAPTNELLTTKATVNLSDLVRETIRWADPRVHEGDDSLIVLEAYVGLIPVTVVQEICMWLDRMPREVEISQGPGPAILPFHRELAI